MKRTIFLSIALLLSGMCFAQHLPIIPQPVSATVSGGKYLKFKQIRYCCDQSNDFLVRNFDEQLARLGVKMAKAEKADKKNANLVLEIKAGTNGNESYRLNITEKNITITAQTPNGLFHGLQSLAQLAVAEPVTSGAKVQCASVQDYPHFGWRGLMLDESRHFFGKEKVKQLLDWMAFYKLNRFHWHLTDEPGWRIEIKKYPLLTTVGGKGNYHDKEAAPKYYTQAEIKEIVQYAADRFIEVIPEIDMPGHATAANRAYPEFSGGGTEKYPEFTFNPGKESVYAYLTDILRETANLFPSKYIHLGGDEVHFGNEKWNTDPEVKALSEKHNLKDLQAVEHYFINRMTDSVASLNKTMIGWDEIVTAKTPINKSKVMWWRHDKPEQLEMALSNGYRAVLCPRIPLYFDFVQHASHQSGRFWQKDFAPIDKILNFRNMYSAPLAKYPELIDGIQANIWTETIHTPERLDYMTFPRIAALAEVAWSKDDSPVYQEFIKRMQTSFRLYKQENIRYFDPENPGATPEIIGVKK